MSGDAFCEAGSLSSRIWSVIASAPRTPTLDALNIQELSFSKASAKSQSPVHRSVLFKNQRLLNNKKIL
jgi:hypothetical protein